MIKKEFIDKCAKYCKKEKDAEVLHAESVRKINEKSKGNKKRVLVITNQFITYFKEQKQVKPDHLHYWRNVSSFDINDQTVIIKFEKDTQMRFIHPNIEEVKSVLLQLFLRTFSSEELGPLDLSHFPHPPIGVNGRGILSRFDTLFRMDDKDPNISARKFFEQFLLKRSKYVKFDKSLEIDDVLPLLLEALRPLPYLQYLSIPKINESTLLYEALTQFVSKNSELKMLVLHNNPDDNSSGFFDALRESPVSQIKGLSFEDIEFTEDELNKVRDLSIERHFTSASFVNSIPTSLLGTFNTTFLSNELMAKLRYLSLDRTTGISLKKLGKRINALSVLSLANCELDIADVFEAFEEAQLENLRFLNLSGNKMSRSTSAQIPKYLERLHVSNVSWGEGILPQFIQYFLSQTFDTGLKFNCSSAQEISDDDWDEIDSTFSSLDKYPLEEFSWSNNKISKSLVNYLSKNRKLSTLFLSNCFDVDQESEVYQTFCQKIPEIESLSNLVIIGSGGTELRDKISDLLEGLKQLKSLNLLIVDGNKIKDDGIQGIKDLISSNNSVHTVSFDGSYMSNTDPFRDLVEAGRARRRPLHISWPINDIERLEDSIGKDELQILKKDVTLLSTGRGNVVSSAKWLQELNNQQQQSKLAASQRNVRINRGSVRIKNNQIAPQAPEKKKDTGRKIRAGSFRGMTRPSLLSTEKSQTEEDPNLWINEPFDMFFVDFNDDFPLFITDEVSEYFKKNPIGEESEGKKHKHHSSKHHSSKHSHHHSSKHHSSKHHHHKNDKNEENENDKNEENENDKNDKNEENENDVKNEEEPVAIVKTRDLKIENDDNDNENNENEDNENDNDNNDNSDENKVDDSDENKVDDEEENRRQKRDEETRERLEKEQQKELEIEHKRLNRQKDRETRETLEKEKEEELEKEKQRREKEIKRKEKERMDREMAEKRERKKEVDDKNKKTRDISPLEKRSTRQGSLAPELENLNKLFESIQELEPIEPPKNMFLYVDPYGRPVNEPIKFSDGSTLNEFNPDPLDLISMAPPELNKLISTTKKPQIVRRWPPESEINRSSLDKSSGEFNLINVDELRFEELPDFDDDDDIDEDEELEKVESIDIHKRDREDNGAFRIPEKRFPVFPLLNVSTNENNDSVALPIDWNFQFSQITKIGNYKYNKEADKPLSQLVDDINENIQKDQTE